MKGRAAKGKRATQVKVRERDLSEHRLFARAREPVQHEAEGRARAARRQHRRRRGARVGASRVVGRGARYRTEADSQRWPHLPTYKYETSYINIFTCLVWCFFKKKKKKKKSKSRRRLRNKGVSSPPQALDRGRRARQRSRPPAPPARTRRSTHSRPPPPAPRLPNTHLFRKLKKKKKKNLCGHVGSFHSGQK